MTREKKIELKKYNSMTKDMSEEEQKNYDLLLELQKQFGKLVGELHCTLFPEEYDFIYDSNVDAQMRKKGENPMCKEYIQKRNNIRVSLGFSPLSKSGYPEKNDNTMEYCKELICKR